MKRSMTARTNVRPLLGMVGVFIVATMLGGRLASIQLLRPDRFVAWGEGQRLTSFELSADRGAIVDRNGVDLAVTVPRPSIWADPGSVVDPAATARQLCAVLGTDPIVVEERLTGEASFAYIARQVDPALAAEVMALGLAGVNVVDEPSRVNPIGGGLGRSLLGRAGVDNAGVSGLELQFADILSGEPGRLRVEQSLDGGTIPEGVFEIEPATPGETLMLTIDRTLQFETERLLADAVALHGARQGVVAVADVETGEILALANVAAGDGLPLRQTGQNLAATMIFEPGSIMKPITFAGLVDRGLLSPSESFDVPPDFTVYAGTEDEKTFRDTPPRYERAYWQPYDILAHSSNVGTISVVEQRATDAGLHENLVDFGFGSVTSVGFPGEGAGIVPPVDSWDGLTPFTTAIGQGVAVTPLQVLQAYLILANDGSLVPPTLVRGTVSEDGVITPIAPTTPRQVVNSDTARAITEMLTEVLDVGSTGAQAAVPGYQVAGKTGTAWQILEDGTYGEDGNRHSVVSFAGYAPAENPQLVAVVILDDPATFEASGGRVAAPLFAEVMRLSLANRHVPPPQESIEELAPVDGTRVRVLTTASIPTATTVPTTSTTTSSDR